MVTFNILMDPKKWVLFNYVIPMPNWFFGILFLTLSYMTSGQ